LGFVRWILRWFGENLLFLLVWSLIVGSGGGIVVAIPDLWKVESRGVLAFVSVVIGGTGLAAALRWILDGMKKAYEARQQKEREEEDARTRAEQQSMEFRKGVRVIAECRMNLRRVMKKPDILTDHSQRITEQHMNRIVDLLELTFGIRTPRRFQPPHMDIEVPYGWDEEDGRNPYVPLNSEEWLRFVIDIEGYMEERDLEGAQLKYPL